ncbi:hypothetical protein PFMALIP_05452 [Plasmodium falciparum MaliPS096_E11]|uniref:Uncharacterized protein n=1 Tax=Plasmodium falciparum MaliPS096_E11 TaxID=1036727 RepID=A0A024WH48_PLAFA|nr:hypothetical protein PFMALIP_05452 [Plasmodium falciparum MaliPS096_E11]
MYSSPKKSDVSESETHQGEYKNSSSRNNLNFNYSFEQNQNKNMSVGHNKNENMLNDFVPNIGSNLISNSSSFNNKLEISNKILHNSNNKVNQNNKDKEYYKDNINNTNTSLNFKVDCKNMLPCIENTNTSLNRANQNHFDKNEVRAVPINDVAKKVNCFEGIYESKSIRNNVQEEGHLDNIKKNSNEKHILINHKNVMEHINSKEENILRYPFILNGEKLLNIETNVVVNILNNKNMSKKEFELIKINDMFYQNNRSNENKENDLVVLNDPKNDGIYIDLSLNNDTHTNFETFELSGKIISDIYNVLKKNVLQKIRNNTKYNSARNELKGYHTNETNLPSNGPFTNKALITSAFSKNEDYISLNNNNNNNNKIYKEIIYDYIKKNGICPNIDNTLMLVEDSLKRAIERQRNFFRLSKFFFNKYKNKAYKHLLKQINKKVTIKYDKNTILSTEEFECNSTISEVVGFDENDLKRELKFYQIRSYDDMDFYILRNQNKLHIHDYKCVKSIYYNKTYFLLYCPNNDEEDISKNPFYCSKKYKNNHHQNDERQIENFETNKQIINDNQMYYRKNEQRVYTSLHKKNHIEFRDISVQWSDKQFNNDKLNNDSSINIDEEYTPYTIPKLNKEEFINLGDIKDCSISEYMSRYMKNNGNDKDHKFDINQNMNGRHVCDYPNSSSNNHKKYNWKYLHNLEEYNRKSYCEEEKSTDNYIQHSTSDILYLDNKIQGSYIRSKCIGRNMFNNLYLYHTNPMRYLPHYNNFDSYMNMNNLHCFYDPLSYYMLYEHNKMNLKRYREHIDNGHMCHMNLNDEETNFYMKRRNTNGYNTMEDTRNRSNIFYNNNNVDGHHTMCFCKIDENNTKEKKVKKKINKNVKNKVKNKVKKNVKKKKKNT